MRLSKQGRGKKGSVAPMSDDEDNNGVEHFHQSNAYQSRQKSRGVSFTTSRGKIWLILVVNLFIITTFIFLSSSRFPSQYGEGVVNDALEQDQLHPGPVNKNSEQTLSLAIDHSTVAEEPQVQETSRPEGYTKLTSTDIPKVLDEEFGATDTTETEGQSGVLSNMPVNPSMIPDDRREQTSQPPLSSKTQQAYASVPDVIVDREATPTTANDGISSTPSSNVPLPGQRSRTEIADIISRMKESQGPSSQTLQPSPEQPTAAEFYNLHAATASPQYMEKENEPSAVESKAFVDDLVLWLTSDSGVEVENLAVCLASSGEDLAACGVSSWINQVASSDPNAADSTTFRPVSPQQKPVWIPIAPDTHNQLPTVHFSCPMVTDALRVHESMTLLFVLSPAQIETGDSYTEQKFFGNSPYGQFSLHGAKPSFFANNGLVESAQELPAGQFSILVYRVYQGFVEIKANGGPWGGELPVEGKSDERRIRFTVNDVVSIGNSKGGCDTNAFQGRIAEVLVYDAVLDDAKVKMAEKYLHDKWWGNKPFPERAPTVKISEPTSEAPHLESTDDSPTLAPVDSAIDTVSDPPEVKPDEAQQQDPSTVKSFAEDTQQTSSSKKPHTSDDKDTPSLPVAIEVEDATPVPKFNPRVNIFEWTPPAGSDSTKAARWTSTVKEKVNYIRNFQLGGDVLRALIRQHKDELVALREELFG